jgi:hypothetical protein
VWQWEQHRVEGKNFLSTEKRKFEDSGEQLITSILSMTRSTLADTSEYKIPPWARAEIINQLSSGIHRVTKDATVR